MGSAPSSGSRKITRGDLIDAAVDYVMYALCVGLAFYLLAHFTFGLHFTFVQCAVSAFVFRFAKAV